MSSEEVEWLRSLAGGVTVAALAEDAGYSERVVYRRLKQVYQRLGARGRTESTIIARDEGWL